MLILGRRQGESIIIGGNIKVTINKINRHSEVELGIEAPRSIVVDREEIYQRKIKDTVTNGKPTATS